MSGEEKEILNEIDDLKKKIQIKTSYYDQKFEEFSAMTTVFAINSDEYTKFLSQKKSILMKIFQKKNKNIDSLHELLIDFNNEYNEIIIID